MKRAFSNIAWTPHDDPSVLALLSKQGFTGIEVAPTKVWPMWAGATPAAAADYRRYLHGMGFEIPALQSVLFDQTAARLFDRDGEAAFIEHLGRVAELAACLGAKVVVLGAPKQRLRGALPVAEALDRAVGVFRRLAETYAAHGVCLCIEPNPRRYQCDFIINAREGSEIVRRVDHPGFGLHLDSAGMYLEKDDLARAWPEVRAQIRHFHLSEPDLGDFRNPRVPHHTNLQFLRSSGYAAWVSVEMREPAEPLAIAGPWGIFQERD